MGIVVDLMDLPAPRRMRWFAEQSGEARAAILSAFRNEVGTPWGLWIDDPAGFVRGPLGEFLWSGEVELLEGIRDYRRLTVPACHGPGKSHTMGRAVAHWIAAHRPGTAVAITTAPTYRQVRNILWPHIRRCHSEHQLPGVCNQVEWQVGPDVVAYGFSPARWDDTGAQGVHAEHVLVVIDEAGGILPALGDALNGVLTSEHSRIVAVGNPPIDEEGTWFEGLQNNPQWHTIRIPAHATPNFTGEEVPDYVARALVTKRWVEDVVEAYGVDSAYYIARVLAMFPKGASNKAIPAEWIDRCSPRDDEDGRPASEAGTGGWQRLGVDVASDGGDEFVIAHLNGMRASIVDAAQAADNSNQVDCAERVLGWIHHVEAIQRREGFDKRKPRVKIDAIGIGRGTYDILVTMGKDGRHHSDIVAINSAEKATEPTLYHNKRAEAWWNMRELVREMDVVLDLTTAEKAQLNAPKWKEDTSGRIIIEKKSDMKKRGLGSPDRADAVIYAAYEPEHVAPPQTSTPVLAGAGRSIPRRPRSRFD